MEFDIFVLSNGLKVIHREVKETHLGHCALMVKTGSRDEEEDEAGYAHFIEHTIFKGTTKRKAFHIMSRLDAVGGELNAYTTKEETAIHASFLKNYYDRAIELIFDLCFNPTFPEKEIAKEREVIMDEIYSYMDNPSEMIFEEFEERLFNGHSLGKSILGNIASLNNANRNSLMCFYKKHFKPSNMVFASIGNISTKKLKYFLEKYIDYAPATIDNTSLMRSFYKPAAPFNFSVKKEVYQAHCIIGSQVIGLNSDKRRVLVLLNNILGGPALNSRLNLNIREKYGYTYNLESNYSAFSDCGVFQVYLGTDSDYLNKSIHLVMKELNKLRTQSLSEIQLKQVKQQLIGQFALSRDNLASMMLSIGKSLMYFDRVDTLEEVFEQIEQISSSELLEMANQCFSENMLSTYSYLPINGSSKE